jgi:hypothetical protein
MEAYVDATKTFIPTHISVVAPQIAQQMASMNASMHARNEVKLFCHYYYVTCVIPMGNAASLFANQTNSRLSCACVIWAHVGGYTWARQCGEATLVDLCRDASAERASRSW